MSYLRKFREAKTKAEAKASIMGRIEKLWLEMKQANAALYELSLTALERAEAEDVANR